MIRRASVLIAGIVLAVAMAGCGGGENPLAPIPGDSVLADVALPVSDPVDGLTDRFGLATAAADTLEKKPDPEPTTWDYVKAAFHE